MSRSGLPRVFLAMLIIFFLPAGEVLGESGETILFQQGNEAYSRGDYTLAITSYEQIIDTAGYSPSVLFNLANSYAQSGAIGKAVLNYERGLRLAPSDSDISGNLELLIKESGLFPKEASGFDKYLGVLNLNQWSYLIVFSLVILSIFALLTLKFRFSRQLNLAVGLSGFLLLCLSSGAAAYHFQYFNPMVVISPDERLFISPFDTATSIGAIQEGRRVYSLKTHGSFTYVVDETNRKGWIPSSSIEHVCKH